MINEVTIDHTKPVWVNVSTMSGIQRRIYLMTFLGTHYCVVPDDEEYFLNGKEYGAEPWFAVSFIKPKESIPLDSKTCPRRPALTHKMWGSGVEYYPAISELGLDNGSHIYTWKLLFEKGYLINGLPSSREVDE